MQVTTAATVYQEGCFLSHDDRDHHGARNASTTGVASPAFSPVLVELPSPPQTLGHVKKLAGRIFVQNVGTRALVATCLTVVAAFTLEHIVPASAAIAAPAPGVEHITPVTQHLRCW